MTEVPGDSKPPWWRQTRLVALLTGLVVLLGGGSAAVAYSAQSRDDVRSAGPSGSATPPGASTSPSPPPSPTGPPPGADIKGPLNFLLVGIDPRPSVPTWRPNADAVLVLHVSRGLDRAYLTSLPRDLLVDIPAFPKARFGGARTKLTHAMSYGSRVPGTGIPNTAQGLQLLTSTVSRYTGIARFDGSAVLNFQGMRRLVDAIGGIDLYVDQQVASIHVRPDGRARPRGASSTGYVGPQKVYPKGTNHLNGWQALDYSRQRYGLPGGDYDRQRHQRQLIKALVAKVTSRNLMTNPAQLGNVLSSLRGTLTFAGRRTVTEYAYALRKLSAASTVLIGLPGRGVGRGSGYLGEQLDAVARSYFAAVRADTVDAFVRANSRLVNRA